MNTLNNTRVKEIGAFLRNQRELLGHSLETMSAAIMIDEQYISMIEEGEHIAASKKVYVIGVICNVAKYLKLDHDKILAYIMNNINTLSSENGHTETIVKTEKDDTNVVSKKSLKYLLTYIAIIASIALIIYVL